MKKQKQKPRPNQKKKRASANTIGRSHRKANADREHRRRHGPTSFEEMFGY